MSFFTGHHDHNFLEEIKAFMNLRHLAKKLSKNNVVVIVVPHGSDVSILPMLSKRINPKMRLVVDFHGITPQHNKYLQRRLIEIYHRMTAKYLIKRSDCVIVHSNFMHEEVSRSFKVKSAVIPFGVNTERFKTNIVERNRIRKQLSLEEKFVLLYVGRLVKHKRVDLLLEALYKLRDENTKLLIVGGGPEKERLEKYAKARKLTQRILFVGYVPDDDLPKYYNACDVFVTASSHEGFCVPILEAFASGKPVIAPNQTAIPETVSNGGLIYEPFSVESLIEKIKLIRADPTLRRTLGKKSRIIANQRNNRRYLKEYKEFLEWVSTSPEKEVF